MISRAIRSRTLRSRPITLTELAPLTPESCSSMLSWMYCEKLRPIPANSFENSACNFLMSVSLVSPAGHCSNGLSDANSSKLLKPAASLPSSGRPCCETTVITSGCVSRISRSLFVTGMPASSDIVGGIVTRIQRLPSSRCGRNSVPSRGFNAGTMVRTHQYYVGIKSYTFMVSATLFRYEARDEIGGDKRLLRLLIDIFVANCASHGERPVLIRGAAAREVHAENCERGPATIARYHFVDDWLYQLIVVGPTGMGTSIEAQHFMQSFRILGK